MKFAILLTPSSDLNHKATKSKANTGTTTPERSVEQTRVRGGGGGLKDFYSKPTSSLVPMLLFYTEIHKKSVRIKAPNSVNASKRKHKIKLITMINKDEYSWLILLYARVNEKQQLNHGGPSQRHIVKPQPTC